MNNVDYKYTDYLFIVLLVVNGGVVSKTLGYGPVIQVFTVVIMSLFLLLNGRILLGNTVVVIVIAMFILFLTHYIHFITFDYNSFLSLQVLNFVSLIVLGVLAGNQFYDRSSEFISRLTFVLQIIIIHGVISCLFMSVLPTNNVIFTAADGKSQYTGYSYFLFQRTHVNYFGDIEGTKNSIGGLNLYRAHGFFWEPGVFAFFINLYSFINLFVYNRVNKLKYSVVAIVLTWSTTGFIVFAMQIVIYAVEFIKMRRRQAWKIFVFGGLGVIMLAPLILTNLNNKLVGENKGSAAQRYADTYGAFSVFRNNPFYGVGVDFDNLITELERVKVDFGYASSQIEGVGKDSVRLSNSFMLAFVYFGLLGGLLLCYCLFKQSFIPYKRWLFFLINALSLSAIPLLFLGFHFTLIVSGFRHTFLSRRI